MKSVSGSSSALILILFMKKFHIYHFGVRHPTVRLYQNTKMYEGKLKMYRYDLHRLPSLSFPIFCTSVQKTGGREQYNHLCSWAVDKDSFSKSEGRTFHGGLFAFLLELSLCCRDCSQEFGQLLTREFTLWSIQVILFLVQSVELSKYFAQGKVIFHSAYRV